MRADPFALESSSPASDAQSVPFASEWVTLTRLLGHRSLATTSRYLKIATSTVCATASPLDLLPKIEPLPHQPSPPAFF